MKKTTMLILLSVFIVFPIFSGTFAEKYDLKNRTLYSTKGHPKAKGVTLTIKIPSFWEVQEGDRPNVVKKFLYYDDDVFVSTSILIMNPIEDSRSDKVIADDFFQKEYLENLLPVMYTYIDGDVTTFDNIKGCWIVAELNQSAAGIDISSYALMQFFIYNKRIVMVLHSVSDSYMESDQDYFLQYLPIFQVIGASIVLPDQWK